MSGDPAPGAVFGLVDRGMFVLRYREFRRVDTVCYMAKGVHIGSD